MHFIENDQVKAGMETIEKHFNEIAKRELTQEQLLGFQQDDQRFSDHHNFIFLIQNDFRSLATVYEQVDNYLNSEQTMVDLRQFSERVSRSYLSFDHESGFINKSFINGQMSLYKEWLDFAQSHDVHSNENFDELKKGLMDVAVFFKKAAMTVQDLGSTVKEIKENSRNTPYVKALINDFKEFFDEHAGKPNDFMFNINQNLTKYQNTFSTMRNDVEYLKETLAKRTPECLKSMANKFCDSQISTNTEISNFLKSKDFDDMIDTRIQLKGQSRPDSILFKDGSYAYVEAGKYEHTTSQYDYYNHINELQSSAIGHLLRKKPKVAEFFKRFLEDRENVAKIIPVMDTYQHYNDVITRSGINVLQMTDKSLEAVDDSMNEVIRQHKLKQYIHSILSKKYEHLLTPEATSVFKILYDTGVTKQALQDYVGKKIAALKTPEEFLEYVNKVKSHFSGFTPDALSAKLEGNGIIPCIDKDGVVVFHVKNFDLSKKLGSASWCISRTSSYFDDYTEQGARQYFMYDFNQNESSVDSMIGFTVRLDGTVSASHLKNDDSFNFDSKYKELHLEVLKNDFDAFKLCDEFSKIMKEKYNLGNYVEKPKNKGLKI